MAWRTFCVYPVPRKIYVYIFESQSFGLGFGISGLPLLSVFTASEDRRAQREARKKVSDR